MNVVGTISGYKHLIPFEVNPSPPGRRSKSSIALQTVGVSIVFKNEIILSIYSLYFKDVVIVRKRNCPPLETQNPTNVNPSIVSVISSTIGPSLIAIWAVFLSA